MTVAKDYNSFDLDHFESAVNTASARARGLWLGFVALITYLVITVGAVTHRDLLLEATIKLPVLNIELPLTGFFFVAPIFFLINHFYMLLNLAGLRRRIRYYNEAVEVVIEHDQMRSASQGKRRLNVDTFVFVQAFGADPKIQKDIYGVLLWFVLFFTLALAPVALLLQMQYVFLPYHDVLITWSQRMVVFLDLYMLGIFWPVLMSGEEKLPLFPPWLGDRSCVYFILGSLAFIVSAFVLVFPETCNRKLAALTATRSEKGTPANSPEDSEKKKIPQRTQLVTKNLNLNGQPLIDNELYHKVRARRPLGEQDYEGERTLFLRRSGTGRGRNFIGASLVNADLRGVDLQYADLRCADLRFARLQGANFFKARLDGAVLDRASLDGANFRKAILRDTKLKRATLKGANFIEAELPGANFFRAKLEGANLANADLRGADLGRTRMQGAYLFGAKLQGASLWRSDLTGANLSEALLHGTYLRRATLTAADLSHAKLQGANLSRAKLNLARLNTTYMWRAKMDNDLSETFLEGEIPKPIDTNEFNEIASESIKDLNSNNAKKIILRRVELINPDYYIDQEENYSLDYDPRLYNIASRAYFILLKEKKDTPPLRGAKHYMSVNLRAKLRNIACQEEFRPYIAQNISERIAETMCGHEISGELGKLFLRAAKSLKIDGKHRCPGAVGVADWAITRFEWAVERKDQPFRCEIKK